MTDRVGQRFGDYRLTRFIGCGGFGDVYLGEHIQDKTLGAVKVLRADMRDQTDLQGYVRKLKEFINEASAFNLSHPNILPLLAFGLSKEDTPFLVFKYARNGSLRRRHPGGQSVPLASVISYVKPLAEALQYAHDHKRIHRDVKPENMLLGEHNEILLSDFGIAVFAHSANSFEEQNLSGTADYIAPEQILRNAQPASDQYSLAVVVYEWLCGERPFIGSTVELIGQHLSISPPPLRYKNPSILPNVEYVIMKALAKKPEQRFVNISTFALALQQAINVGTTPLILRMPSVSTPAQVPFAIKAVSSPVQPVSPPLNTPNLPAQAGMPKVPIPPPLRADLENPLRSSLPPKKKRRTISLDLLIGLPLSIIAVLLEFFLSTKIPENITFLILFGLYLLPRLLFAIHLDLRRCIDKVGYRLFGKAGWRFWFWLNAPGIVLRQLSRVIVMLLLYPFGFRLTSITFFRVQEGIIQDGTKRGLTLGAVNYKRPAKRLTSYIGDGLSSIAPLIVGVALFIFLYWLSTGHNIWEYSWQSTLQLQIARSGWLWWLFIPSCCFSLIVIPQLWLKRQEWKGSSFLAISLVLIIVIAIVLASTSFIINIVSLLNILSIAAHLDLALLALLAVDIFFILVARGVSLVLREKHL